MEGIINVGLIGFGTAGRVFHAPLISATPGFRLTKIVQRRGDDAARAYPTAQTVRDASDLFDDQAIGLVVIATPNASHFAVAEQALLAGKHVVVDKPFTVTSGDAQRLIDVARARGRMLSVFQNRRWDADFLTVQRIVKTGLLGRLVGYEAHFDRFRPQLRQDAWRERDTPGAGILYDLGSHLIDQALCLFGRPSRVYGELRRQRESVQADDYFEVGLGYDEVKVTLTAGMLVREPGPQFILHGTRGSFLKQRHEPQETALKNAVPLDSPDWGRETPEQWGIMNTDLDGLHVRGTIETIPGCYPRYYRNVYDAIANGAELTVKPEQACDVIRVIELVIASSAQRCALAADFPMTSSRNPDSPV